MPSCFTIWTQGAYAVVNHFFVPCWKNHEGGLPLGGFIWHQVPEVCTTLASLNQNWSKLTASPGMHPTALWHFLKTMRCSTCCSACLHVCLHNLIASQRTSSMCGPSWPLKDNSLSASSVCIFQAWVNGSQIWNTLKPWEPPPEPSCCPANTVHCWKSSIACRTPSNPAFKAPFKWKKSSTASRIRGKLFLAKRKLTGHLESPYKGGSLVSCQRCLPAWSHWKPAGIRSPKLRKKSTGNRFNPPPGTSVWSARVLSFHVPGPRKVITSKSQKLLQKRTFSTHLMNSHASDQARQRRLICPVMEVPAWKTIAKHKQIWHCTADLQPVKFYASWSTCHPAIRKSTKDHDICDANLHEQFRCLQW